MKGKRKIRNPFAEYEKFTDLSSVAKEHLGIPGRMLYHSKSRGKATTIFNANIFDRKAKKIWYGDLEIERDREALLVISGKIGPLYVLYEMEGRFLEFVPTKRYVEAKAAVTVSDGRISYSKGFAYGVAILTYRARASKRWPIDITEVKSGVVEAGRLKEKMRYEMYRSLKGEKGRHYVVVTPDCLGGFAFGKTPESALKALKRLYTIRKEDETKLKTQNEVNRRTK